MTTYVEEKVTCAVCRTDTTISILGSTNQFGHPDLDLRPPEMARSTIRSWLQECPSCGYSATQITVADAEVKAFVQGETFKVFRAGLNDLHEAARPFRTAAFLAAERSLHASAFHHTLHEAWIHDDLEDDIRARAARLNAIDHLHQVHSDVKELFEEDGGDAAIEADMLRRAGEFEKADEVCRRGLRTDCDGAVRQVLDFEIALCALRDAGCHSMAEVFGG